MYTNDDENELNPLEQFILQTVGPQNMNGEVANRMRAALRQEVVNIQTEVKTAENEQLRDAYLKEMIANKGNLHKIVEIKQKYAHLGLNVY